MNPITPLTLGTQLPVEHRMHSCIRQLIPSQGSLRDQLANNSVYRCRMRSAGTQVGRNSGQKTCSNYMPSVSQLTTSVTETQLQPPTDLPTWYRGMAQVSPHISQPQQQSCGASSCITVVVANTALLSREHVGRWLPRSGARYFARRRRSTASDADPHHALASTVAPPCASLAAQRLGPPPALVARTRSGPPDRCRLRPAAPTPTV